MKVCRVCKQDCSSKARVRDPEGNYYCKACFDEQKAAASASPAAGGATIGAGAGGIAAGAAAAHAPVEDPALGGDDGFQLADMLGDVVPDEGSATCPECGWSLRVGAALCVNCGYDPVKGKVLRTAVKGPERDPIEAEYAAKRAKAASAAAMTPVLMVTCSVITGLVVAGAWMLIAYSLNRDFRGMAIVAGLVIGGGAIKGARGHCGPLVGLTAALVALAAILGGRYGAVSMIVDDNIKMLQRELVDEETVLLVLAGDVATDWENEGKSIGWPLGFRPERIRYQEDCPADLWEATEARWAQMSPAQKQTYTYQVDDMVNEYWSAHAGVVKEEVFAINFNAWFIATLAIGVVFAFGMGTWGDDLPF